MEIVGFLIVIFLIAAAIAVINIAFGPFNVPPQLKTIAAIIGFVILVLVVLGYFGYLPGSLRLK